jgi:xylulokinase
VDRPRPHWAEQHVTQWWRATDTAILRLAAGPHGLRGVRGIGVAGQMHGAVVLDGALQALRPAILWNDGRSSGECVELESERPALRTITGNLAMPGFTAPKLRWLRRHEPEVFGAMRYVMLPKDWLVLQLSGELSTEMSDASGTLWLDVGSRLWSSEMLEACGMTPQQVPPLHEGTDAIGHLRAELARRWGIGAGCVIAAGAGDNAAAAIGLGATEPGQGFVSLGTSGVAFRVSDGFRPKPERAVHAFCHALPQRWHQMGVMLSAAGSLQWAAAALGYPSVLAMMDEVELVGQVEAAEAPLFLPYLSGERSPHNDPAASGVFFGLRADQSRAVLAHSVTEGVAFGMTDCLDSIDALQSDGPGLGLVGGAARSRRLRTLLAAAAGVALHPLSNTAHAAAVGAAALARSAATREPTLWRAASGTDPVEPTVPSPEWSKLLKPRLARYRALYVTLKQSFLR